MPEKMIKGMVAATTSATLHSRTSAMIKPDINSVMFWSKMETSSLTPPFTSLAVEASLVTIWLLVFSSLSNQPTSKVLIAARSSQDHVRNVINTC